MDFGYLGLVPDRQSGRRRKVWALVLVWRYSRHCFVWPTTSPDARGGGGEAGGGLGVLRWHAPLPRHRQLPGSGGPRRGWIKEGDDGRIIDPG